MNTLKTHPCLAFQQFQQEHSHFLNDPIVHAFFQESKHLTLLLDALCSSSSYATTRLDESFQAFYTGVKLVHYLSKTIHWEAIHYDKTWRKRNEQFPLVLDQPITTDENQTLVSSYDKQDTSLFHTIFEWPTTALEEKIANETLYYAFDTLTDRQKEVLYFIYGKEETTRAISEKLAITQQGVSRIHQQALTKLRNQILKKEKGEIT